jgi:hypothetical protein
MAKLDCFFNGIKQPNFDKNGDRHGLAASSNNIQYQLSIIVPQQI